MADIIRLLPDAVANQIAAGEVIQRPASVVKELMENAIDAHADSIMVVLKDSGRTLIQIADNGCGMSDTDARMAFERHATSKITQSNDLFALQTFGFRGEALASIAAVAEVSMRTRRPSDELGTLLEIAASEIRSHEPDGCPEGTTITVRNLFFNVPARRKFLKSNTTELKHILSEFQRVVLCHPEVEFSLVHNEYRIFHLPKSNYKQRIVHLFGKTATANLISINTSTSIANIHGYVGKPEMAKKSGGDQYFFVNNRYMKHPMFHRAVMQAFERLIPGDAHPAYFVYFEVDPETIDVNIHPAKTEIKFENDQALFQMLLASVREGLGKFNAVPSIDFETSGLIDIPILSQAGTIEVPRENINLAYNPFETTAEEDFRAKEKSREKDNLAAWQSLYEGFEGSASAEQTEAEKDQAEAGLFGYQSKASNFLQIKNKYILAPVKSGLMIIDQKRAHERILFETYLGLASQEDIAIQKILFPKTIPLSPVDYTLALTVLPDLQAVGFDVCDFGNNTLVINGIPAGLDNVDPVMVLLKTIGNYRETEHLQVDIKERIAGNLASASAIDYGESLSHQEMQGLFDNLFACRMPNFTFDGKPVLQIIAIDELEKKMG